MIPPLLFVGLVAGVFIRRRRSLRRVVAGCVVVALMFGLGVGMSDGDLGLVAGAAALVLANLTIGSLVGAAIGAALGSLSRRGGAPT